MNLPSARRKELDRLVDTLLAHYAAFELSEAAVQSCRYFPDVGWSVVKELVRQAPDDDVLRKIASIRDPLETLISKHGSAVIDRIEAEARSNPTFKKCLAMVSIASNRIGPELWSRLADASGRELEVRPHSEPRFLREEEPNIDFYLDYDFHPLSEPPRSDPARMASAWLGYQETFWAWEEVNTLIDAGDDEAWFVLNELIRRSSDERVLSAIGAGPLENWLERHGDRVMFLAEEAAAKDRRWRVAISAVWQGEMSDELYARVVRARGEEPARG